MSHDATPVLPPLRGQLRTHILNGGLLRGAAYLHPDGVLVKVEVEAPVKGASRVPRVEVWHHFPSRSRRVVSSRHGGPPEAFLTRGRIVVHDPSMVLDGLQRVEVWYGNRSQTMEVMNISCDTVTIVTAAGATHRVDIYPWASPILTLQPDAPTRRPLLRRDGQVPPRWGGHRG